MTYRFGTQDRIGQLGAQLLDGYFTKLWQLRSATMEEEQAGIDRIAFTPDGRTLKLEYKTDVKTDETGNTFIEVVANSTTRRPGWAHTTSSDLVLYFLPFSNRILFIRPTELRLRLPLWETQYRLVAAPNRGYQTLGLLVPVIQLLRDRVAVMADFSQSQHPYCKHVRENLYLFEVIS